MKKLELIFTFFKQSRRLRRLLLVLPVLLAAYLLLPSGFNWLALSLIRNDQIEEADLIVALGGDLRCERERRAAELYNQGWGSKIVVNGLQYSWGVHTAEAAKRFVVKLGIPERDVLMTCDTYNTRTEAQELIKLMRRNGYKTAIIVTSSSHSRRALYTIERAAPDFKFYSSPVPARPPEWQPTNWWTRRGDVYITIREFLSWTNTLLDAWS
jgi:uncharacterized SAM-binding protein YcdF (DUF218 family)